MSDQKPEVEAELEAFRQQWREEVSARNKRPAGEQSRPSGDVKQERPKSSGGPSTARRKDVQDYSEEVEPRVYHDLPDKEVDLKLGVEGGREGKRAVAEPRSALEHYEHAVEREAQGNLGDSIRHYRQAFKLDDGVHEAYKRKHFPPSSFVKSKPTNVNPSNASATVPNTGHHSLHGSSSTAAVATTTATIATAGAFPDTLKQLIDDFSTLRIEATEPPTSASPQAPCPIGELPEEILTQILLNLAITDVASFARMAQVCKRLAYLILTEESIWKRIALGPEFGFAGMHYSFAVTISGQEIESEPLLLLPAPSSPPSLNLPSPQTLSLLTQSHSSSWRSLFRSRPRIRFNGCYISTVNYTRAGATATNTLTWGAPVHVVTYFRYLRFFRDGSAMSLLTTAEPADVVHHLVPANLHAHHGSFLPSSVMKDALRGRWRITGGRERRWREGRKEGEGGEELEEEEKEGDLIVETEGVVPKYLYKMHFAIAHAGKVARNNKLAWKGFWSYNKLTDDWGEFLLRNDRAFYWSRVKSYGMGDGV